MSATAVGTTTGTPRSGPFRRFVAWLTAKHNSSLVFLLALSLGLALVAPQTDLAWLMVVCSVVWGVTVIAFAAQFAGRHERAHPRHARPA
ncbi:MULTISPECIES: hypothetical protein [Kitasatospora]|uniref:Uncharacterized protein n=1 Tax=Kitasatospora setae (strain ATCC 33774 / DSM 43861 / JCM 3304 / KCC A-0304 / NBRC 14216 / KM-6054) TaxID=452652 RepID=E4N693_KITSK|nr:MULTISPECIES: hypothetical protein [Kitasatospora]BAJ26724.1 hypothetical protein KSE_08870 [Kitasatospora setae KM-6054]